MTLDTSPHRSPAVAERRASIVDLLDRVLATGVVVTGDVTLSIADVDLVRISLRTLIQSIRASTARPDTEGPADERSPEPL
jgi:Gas vesicle protein